jgi:hypothetical protein
MKYPMAEALLREVVEEPFHHVEPGSAGGGEVKMEASMPTQPAFHLGMLLRRVVIHDEMHFPIGGRLRVDEPQEAQPFLVPMLAHTGSDHLPVQGVEGRKQRRRAISFVVVRHRLAPTFFQRQARMKKPSGTSCL